MSIMSITAPYSTVLSALIKQGIGHSMCHCSWPALDQQSIG